jgi:hypothetical protein
MPFEDCFPDTTKISGSIVRPIGKEEYVDNWCGVKFSFGKRQQQHDARHDNRGREKYKYVCVFSFSLTVYSSSSNSSVASSCLLSRIYNSNDTFYLVLPSKR